MIFSACLLSIFAKSQFNQPVPAFLDDLDRITIWVPLPSRTERILNAAQVSIDGKLVNILDVQGRDSPTFASSPEQVVLPGSIQSALGAVEWDPNGQITKMTETAPGIFEFIAEFPKGSYEYKVAKGGSWSENWGADFSAGGANIVLNVPQDQTIVRFVVDFNKSTIKDSINFPNEIRAPKTVPIRPQIQNQTGAFSSFSIQLSQPISSLKSQILVELDGETRPVFAREILNNQKYIYTGQDLGPTYTPQNTKFKIWAPTATKVELLTSPNPQESPKLSATLKESGQGTWNTTLDGELHGRFYVYKLTFPNGETTLAADIYGKSANSGSKLSQVIDLTKTNPNHWRNQTPIQPKSPLDAILYEFHIRDFTINPNSGISAKNRGKYLGLTEPNSKVPSTKIPTGLDYLKWLGITHVHLLPFQNYNPAHSNQYNWGYETTLFNVPEEQYSTNPNLPIQTIQETKTMIAEMQKAGIGVVLDVVYNHSVPSQGSESAFWASTPYFYFRTNDKGDVLNESGVGNALNDDNPMVRKFIRDSLIFWADEYNLDGFRFDLLGMFTPETIEDLAKAIRSVNPHALIYGEPWTGGGPNRSPKGSLKGLDVAVFNDNFRNILKGGLDDGRPGFIDSNPIDQSEFTKNFLGATELFTNQPTETINYISAHDNLSLWDAITASQPNHTIDQHKSSLKLAGAAILLAQGIPFLEGGAELGRTKGGNHNSYNAGDEINNFDWQRGLKFQDVANYYRGLIQIRKSHPAFRITTKNLISKAITPLSWVDIPTGTIGYQINGQAMGDSWKAIIVIFNPTLETKTLSLKNGQWNLIANKNSIDQNGISRHKTVYQLEPQSATILVK